MAAYARQKGGIPVKEEPPELPPYVEHLWRWWSDLNGQRDRTMGVKPIDYAAIETRGRVLREPVLPWEYWAISELDKAYRAWHAEATTPATTTPPPPGPPR